MRRFNPATVIVAAFALVSCSANSVSQQMPTPSALPHPTVVEATHMPAPYPLRVSYPAPYPPPTANLRPTQIPALIPQPQKLLITHVISSSITFLPNAEAGPTAVSFVDAQHGWLGFGAALLATDDGGRSWHDTYDAPEAIVSIDFISLQQGWAVMGKRTLVTRDGGSTWKPVASLSAIDVGVIDFVDIQHGWARVLLETGQAMLLRTINGGATWKTVVDPCNTGFRPGPLNFVDSRLGWAMCGGDPGTGSQSKELFRTNDGGVHWKSVVRADFDSNDPDKLNGGGYLGDSFFVDSTHGWYSATYSNLGGLSSTDDGGQTWKYAGLGGEGRIPFHMRFISPTQGYALIADRGRTRALVTTSDGGATWTQLYPPIAPTGQIQFLDQQQGIATGVPLDPGAIVRTTDAGQTWTQIGSIATDHRIGELHFSDARNGCIQADHYEAPNTYNVVYHTDDGGSTWNLIPGELHCIAPTIVSVGRWQIFGDQLVSSTDGGKTWVGYEVKTPRGLELVSYVDADHAWFKDAVDHLYATSDGGKSWMQLN